MRGRFALRRMGTKLRLTSPRQLRGRPTVCGALNARGLPHVSSTPLYRGRCLSPRCREKNDGVARKQNNRKRCDRVIRWRDGCGDEPSSTVEGGGKVRQGMGQDHRPDQTCHPDQCREGQAESSGVAELQEGIERSGTGEKVERMAHTEQERDED